MSEEKKPRHYIKHFKKLTKAQMRQLIGINNYKILATYGNIDVLECLEKPGYLAVRKIPRDETIYTEYKIDYMTSRDGLLNIVRELKEIWNEK